LADPNSQTEGEAGGNSNRGTEAPFGRRPNRGTEAPFGRRPNPNPSVLLVLASTCCASALPFSASRPLRFSALSSSCRRPLVSPRPVRFPPLLPAAIVFCSSRCPRVPAASSPPSSSAAPRLSSPSPSRPRLVACRRSSFLLLVLASSSFSCCAASLPCLNFRPAASRPRSLAAVSVPWRFRVRPTEGTKP
jgi:hypothetical protein